VLVGVRTGEHLFATEEIERWRERIPSLQVRFAAETNPGDKCAEGYATDLIKELELAPDTRVYLCGPPPMVEAGRSAVVAKGLPRGEVLCERFA
jgi:NAD(P)H-flavin reductase